MSAPFAGTGILVGLALRRDVAVTATWSILFAAVLWAGTESFRLSYPDAAALAGYAAAMAAAPVQRFFNGPGAGLDTLGGLVVFELGGYLLIVVAVLSILIVVRHSRAEEAGGTAELIGAGRTGRHALNAAAFVAAVVAAAWWGLVCAGVLGGLGLGWGGAWAYGASVALAGLLLAAVALVACQLGEQPATATATSGAVLLAAFLLRGAGDLRGDGWWWASPLGWAQATRPFGEAVPAAVAVAGAFAMLAWVAAAVLNSRRDVGAGWVRPRPGPATASVTLRRLPGLVASQQRGAALGWWVVVAVLGAALGLVSTEFVAAEGLLDLTAFLGPQADPVLAFVSFSARLLAVLAAAAGVATVRTAALEERTGRLDLLLAGPVGRPRWLGWHVAGALSGSAVALGLGAAGLVGGLAVTGVDVDLTDAAVDVGAFLPAVWAVTAIAVAVFGARPRLLGLAWLPVVHAVVAGVFGELLRLPAWAIDLTPFAHVAQRPDGVLDAALGLQLVAGAALLGLGAAVFRVRDLAR